MNQLFIKEAISFFSCSIFSLFVLKVLDGCLFMFIPLLFLSDPFSCIGAPPLYPLPLCYYVSLISTNHVNAYLVLYRVKAIGQQSSSTAKEEQ